MDAIRSALERWEADVSDLTSTETSILTFSRGTQENNVDACFGTSDNLLSKGLVVNLVAPSLEGGSEGDSWSVGPERSVDAVGGGHYE
jgi:hypothetical protein